MMNYAEKDSYTFSSLTRSSYIAEGAANRLYWLILNDRKKYPQRNIDISDDALQEDEERYLADGTPHLFEDYYGEKVKYEIRDAVGGMDVSGSMPQRDLIAFMGDLEKDSAERERLEMIGNRLQDYVDSDDLVKLHGISCKHFYFTRNQARCRFFIFFSLRKAARRLVILSVFCCSDKVWDNLSFTNCSISCLVAFPKFFI